MFFYNSENPDISHLSHTSHTMPMDEVFHPHFHRQYEILLVITGNVHYHIDGTEYILKPYDLLLIPASTYHFVIPVSNATYENYRLCFHPSLIDKEQQAFFSQPRVLNVASELLLHRMFGLFDSYNMVYSQGEFQKAARYLLGEILLYISHATRNRVYTKPQTDSDPIVLKIVNYIAQHLHQRLNSDILARELQLSKSYVQNVFSSAMGIGLQQYINQKKIHAAHYDIQSGMAPSDAAAKYGYHNYSSFYRQYKKFFGQSPKKIGK